MRKVSLIETRQEIELITEFVFPPVPFRNHDWFAIDGNTYDASPSGHGSTEQDAIDSLFDGLLETA